MYIYILQHICVCGTVCQDCARCSSTSSPDKPFHSESPISENDVVSLDFTNRNPRNLELIGLARKRKGWKFQYPPVNFYHRLLFDGKGSTIDTQVEAKDGSIVLQASTKEFAIAKHLYSKKDVCAAKNIGRVLAHRCLQSGITNMVLLNPEVGTGSQKLEAFLSAMEEGGVDLFESDEYVKPYTPGIDYDNEEEITNIQERQCKVADVSDEHKKLKEWRKHNHKPRSVWTTPKIPFSLDNVNHRIKPYGDD